MDEQEVQESEDGEVTKYDYHYTGSQQRQPWGEEIGPSWTAHDNPTQPGYIHVCTGPLYE